MAPCALTCVGSRAPVIAHCRIEEGIHVSGWKRHHICRRLCWNGHDPTPGLPCHGTSRSKGGGRICRVSWPVGRSTGLTPIMPSCWETAKLPSTSGRRSVQEVHRSPVVSQQRSVHRFTACSCCSRRSSSLAPPCAALVAFGLGARLLGGLQQDLQLMFTAKFDVVACSCEPFGLCHDLGWLLHMYSC